MSTVSNAVWELQLSVITSAAELVSGLDLPKMEAVTEVAAVAPPSLQANSVFAQVHRAPLADQLALVAAARSFRDTYAALLEGGH